MTDPQPEPPAPEPPAPVPPPTLEEITLEEWIASTQACCGLNPSDDDE